MLQCAHGSAVATKNFFRDEPSRTAILGCSTSQKQVARTGGPRFLKASSLQNSRNSASLLAAIWWISLLQQVFQAFLGEDIRFEVQRPERRKTVRSPARRRTRRTWGTRWCTFLSPTCDFKLCPRKWFITTSCLKSCLIFVLKCFKLVPSWIPVRKVYCHVDLLAARELPAMDDDGLVDPSYSIQVKDQVRSCGCLRFIFDASVIVHSRVTYRHTTYTSPCSKIGFKDFIFGFEPFWAPILDIQNKTNRYQEPFWAPILYSFSMFFGASILMPIESHRYWKHMLYNDVFPITIWKVDPEMISPDLAISIWDHEILELGPWELSSGHVVKEVSRAPSSNEQTTHCWCSVQQFSSTQSNATQDNKWIGNFVSSFTQIHGMICWRWSACKKKTESFYIFFVFLGRLGPHPRPVLYASHPHSHRDGGRHFQPATELFGPLRHSGGSWTHSWPSHGVDTQRHLGVILEILEMLGQTAQILLEMYSIHASQVPIYKMS